jgi:hypothetical protein
MADGRAAYDPDRLPWLTDTRRPRRSLDSTPLLFWAFLAIVLVAGVSYWLGMKSVRQPEEFADVLGRSPPEPADPPPELAQPRAVPLPPVQVQPPGLPDVSPVAEPAPVKIPGVDRALPAKPKAAPPVRKTPAKPEAVAAEPETEEAAAEAPEVRTETKRSAPARTRLEAWPADQSQGAYGRVVRVGTFYSRRQAKQGWARIVRVYPGMRRLRAVVVANPSLRTGQTFYRLQFGTTSQAHSAVLCQRMRVVGLSCVTVGLPGSGAGA